MMQNWMLGILGAIVMVIPFLGLSEQMATWSLVILGVAIVGFSFWNAIGEEGQYSTGR